MNRRYASVHYHIRWSRVLKLYWEWFGTRTEAEASAKQLVRGGETYIIEEAGQDCPRCRAAMNLKTDHDAPAKPVLVPASTPKAFSPESRVKKATA